MISSKNNLEIVHYVFLFVYYFAIKPQDANLNENHENEK